MTNCGFKLYISTLLHTQDINCNQPSIIISLQPVTVIEKDSVVKCLFIYRRRFSPSRLTIHAQQVDFKHLFNIILFRGTLNSINNNNNDNDIM